MPEIGLMGGSFNPIHRGHVALARAALDSGKVERVLFLPTGNPPHKREGLADKFDRLRMVELAVAHEAGMAVCREEIDRAVRDAQRYAAEDAKLKAEATARDRCEQLIFQAGNAKNLSKDDKVRVAEAVKNAKRAVKSKDAAQMNEAAGQLETLLNEVGVHIDPNAEYHGSASYENPNNNFSDDAVDADFEKL